MTNLHLIQTSGCLTLKINVTHNVNVLKEKNHMIILRNSGWVISAYVFFSVHFSSFHFSRSVVSECLRPHELQHTRPPCPSPTPRFYSNSRPSSRWCHPAISSSVIPFSSCPQSLPGSGSFPMGQLFTLGGQSIGVSALASVLPMNTQDWSV